MPPARPTLRSWSKGSGFVSSLGSSLKNGGIVGNSNLSNCSWNPANMPPKSGNSKLGNSGNVISGNLNSGNLNSGNLISPKPSAKGNFMSGNFKSPNAPVISFLKISNAPKPKPSNKTTGLFKIPPKNCPALFVLDTVYLYTLNN